MQANVGKSELANNLALVMVFKQSIDIVLIQKLQ